MLLGCTWSRRLQQKSPVLVGRQGGILGASCLAGLQLRREMRGKSSIEEGMPKGGSIVPVQQTGAKRAKQKKTRKVV